MLNSHWQTQSLTSNRKHCWLWFITHWHCVTLPTSAFFHQWFSFSNFFTWMNVLQWVSMMKNCEMYLDYGTRSKYSFAKYIYNFLYLSLQKLATLLRRTLLQNTHFFISSLFICNVTKIKKILSIKLKMD